ncbi:MAG: hypothetical protein IPL95_06295 [Saprospiraceae bacterium]|nr:hypothetical protein [Saprospiraceae bacterium]
MSLYLCQALKPSIENQLIRLESIEKTVPKNYIELKNKIESIFPSKPYLSYETFEAYFNDYKISGDYENLLEVFQGLDYSIFQKVI